MADTSPALTYSSYLALADVLGAQRPKTDEHDEMLFIVIHQVYELWFKQMIHELRHLQQRLEAGEGPRWGELVLMGLAIGCAFSIKPVVTPEGCLAFALLTFPALRRRVLPARRFLAMAAAYAGLALLPTALFALAYLAQGDLREFLDGSFLAPLRYAEARLSLTEALQRVQVALLVHDAELT